MIKSVFELVYEMSDCLRVVFINPTSWQPNLYITHVGFRAHSAFHYTATAVDFTA